MPSARALVPQQEYIIHSRCAGRTAAGRDAPAWLSMLGMSGASTNGRLAVRPDCPALR